MRSLSHVLLLMLVLGSTAHAGWKDAPTPEALDYYRGLFLEDSPRFSGAEHLFEEAGRRSGNPGYALREVLSEEFDRPNSVLRSRLRAGYQFFEQYYFGRRKQLREGAFEKMGFLPYPLDDAYSELCALAEEADERAAPYTFTEAKNLARGTKPWADAAANAGPWLNYALDMPIVTIGDRTIRRDTFRYTLLENPLNHNKSDLDARSRAWKQKYLRLMTTIRRHNRNNLVAMLTNRLGVKVPPDALQYDGGIVVGFAPETSDEDAKKILNRLLYDTPLLRTHLSPLEGFTGGWSDIEIAGIEMAHWYDSALSRTIVPSLEGTLTDRFTNEVIPSDLANTFDTFREEMSASSDLSGAHVDQFRTDMEDETLKAWSLTYIRWWGLSQDRDYWKMRDLAANLRRLRRLNFSDLVSLSEFEEERGYVNTADDTSLMSGWVSDSNTLFRLNWRGRSVDPRTIPGFFLIPKIQRLVASDEVVAADRAATLPYRWTNADLTEMNEESVVLDMTTERPLTPIGSLLPIEAPFLAIPHRLLLWQSQGDKYTGQCRMIADSRTAEFHILFSEPPPENAAFRYRITFKISPRMAHGSDSVRAMEDEFFDSTLQLDPTRLGVVIDNLRKAGFVRLARELSFHTEHRDLSLEALVEILRAHGFVSQRAPGNPHPIRSDSSPYLRFAHFLHDGVFTAGNDIRAAFAAEVVSDLYGHVYGFRADVLSGHYLVNLDRIDVNHSTEYLGIFQEGRLVAALSARGTYRDVGERDFDATSDTGKDLRPVLVRMIEDLQRSLAKLDENNTLTALGGHRDPHEPVTRLIRLAGALLKLAKGRTPNVTALIDEVESIIPEFKYQTHPVHLTPLQWTLSEVFGLLQKEIRKMAAYANHLRNYKREYPFGHYLRSNVRRDLSQLADTARHWSLKLVTSGDEAHELWQKANAYYCAQALAAESNDP